MPSVNQTSRFSRNSSEIFPVSVETVRALIDFLQVDLYLEQEPNEPLILYRRRTHPVKKSDLDRLAKRGVATLYVNAEDHEACHRVADVELSRNRQFTFSQRYRLLHDFHKGTLQRAFSGSRADEIVSLADETASKLIGLLCRDDLDVRDLLKALDHNEDIYTHSLNVATCVLLLARGLKLDGQDDLRSIVVGALLHDLGKRHILLRNLRKSSPLNARQRKEIHNHPIAGFHELIGRGDVNWGQLMMVYQHHERVDGAGYPVGMPREEIHVWARLCAVANAYCVLTSQNASRKPMHVDEALVVLEQEAGISLDREMVSCWKTLATTTKPLSTA